MICVTSIPLLLLLGAVLEVPAGGDLAGALARARDGDTIRLGPGVHAASLGRRASGALAVEGAGAGRTEVLAPEGQDGLVVEGGEVRLSGLALRAGPARCAVKVLGGAARLDDVVLSGGACGAFVQDGGALTGTGVELAGGYGLLARGGRAALDDGSARGSAAGVAQLGGTLSLARFAVTGPSQEAGVSVSGGRAALAEVVIRTPGPSGLAVTGSAELSGLEVDVTGAAEERGFLGSCLQVRRAKVSLSGGALGRCAGAAVEASGAELALTGVDAAGGEAGGIVLVDGARAELSGGWITGRGPGLVATGGAHAALQMNRWRVDPVLWVDCGSGARVEVGRGEQEHQPCSPVR